MILFWTPFRSIFLDPKMGSKSAPKSSQNQFFLSSRWGLFSLASELPRDALWQSSGLLGAVLGGLKSEKMQTVLCKNHFFESCLFGLSELHLALLGSSRPLPGQSWGPDGTQKPPKATPKLDKKWLQKGIQLGCSWTRFGFRFGAQNVCARGALGGHIFQGFSVKSRPRCKHSSFSCFHVCVCVCVF